MKYVKISMLIILIIIIIISIIIFTKGKTQKNQNENEMEQFSNTENNNEEVESNITDFEMLKIYFEDYKNKAINSTEVAFNLLNIEYKEKKFNNDINLYKEYIQKNMDRFKDANIAKYSVINDGKTRKYAFVDNYNNYYELQELENYEYTIILDNYTLETKELKEKYNTLSNEEKAISNIDKVMELINTKDYSTVYQYLNQNFKKNNFPTIEAFVKYMQQTFFDNNIVGKIKIRDEENVYILSVPYKESLSTAAEQKEKIFLIRLKEGTDFELSFEV